MDIIEQKLDEQYRMLIETLFKNIMYKLDSLELAIKNSQEKKELTEEEQLASDIGKEVFNTKPRKLYPMIPYAS